jgi:hypothetical protein
MDTSMMTRMKELEDEINQRSIPITVACAAFQISQSCYRYESKQNAQNEEIANWLIRLTEHQRNWGFGLCYFVSAQCQELWLEPQAGLPHLPRAGTQFTHQTPKASGEGRT